MSHASDEGFPTNPDYGKGILQASRYLVKFPEQTKYTTQLAHLPDDPEKLQEVYVFLPSLRRSLRLSSAARCSPILGSDWTQDDNGDGMFLQPANFSMKLLGEKKVIVLMHADANNMYGGNSRGGEKLYDRVGMAGWPAPAVGKWELRDAYVLDVVPLPVMSGGYCYGHKIFLWTRRASSSSTSTITTRPESSTRPNSCTTGRSKSPTPRSTGFAPTSPR